MVERMDVHRASRMANIASNEMEGYSSDGVGNEFQEIASRFAPETSAGRMAISENHLMGLGDG